MATPTFLPEFLRCKCVATRLRQRALTYSMKGRKIEISKLKTESISALTDGITVYLNKKDGFTPEFEEGVSYVLQKYALSNAFGQIYLFVGAGTLKFKTVPQTVTEEAETSARQALCPTSQVMSGEEEDIFAKEGYLSLQGHIKEVSQSFYLSNEFCCVQFFL